jgi:hypothetical protein
MIAVSPAAHAAAIVDFRIVDFHNKKSRRASRRLR